MGLPDVRFLRVSLRLLMLGVVLLCGSQGWGASNADDDDDVAVTIDDEQAPQPSATLLDLPFDLSFVSLQAPLPDALRHEDEFLFPRAESSAPLLPVFCRNNR